MERTQNVQIVVDRHADVTNPFRLSVGDVIQSEHFAKGFRFNHENVVTVGWIDDHYPEAHAQQGNGTLAHDESRANAPFLVTSLNIAQGGEPEDCVQVPEFWLALRVTCWRLTLELILIPDSEVIRFAQFDPMSVAKPPKGGIKLLGSAIMPINLGRQGNGG